MTIARRYGFCDNCWFIPVTTSPTPRQLSNHVRTVCTSAGASFPRLSSSETEGGREERAAAGEVVRHLKRAHSMTWSARPSSDWGIVSRSALAVLRLMTSSNFVGCSTGRSAGFAPFKILLTKTATRFQVS